MRINNDFSMIKLYREANRNNNYSEKSLDKLSIGGKSAIAKMESDSAAMAERTRAGRSDSALAATAGNSRELAQSRIKDVDMAKEMLEFTKTSILNQASMAVQAQANQSPQAALQLLR